MKIKYRINFIKTLAAALAFSLFGSCVGLARVGAENENIGRLSHIVTSHNPDNYAVIDASGDTVTVSGKYTSEIPKSVSISGIQVESDSFKTQNGGVFTAEIKGKPLSDGLYNLIILFQSYVYMSYIIGYDNGGWYIPDNGLIGANAEKLNNVRQAEPIAAAYYISPTGNKEEIAKTMEKLQTIANQVCENINDDYQKAYLLNHWIADNIYYDHDAAETEVTIETVALSNVLTNHRTTCAGYANLFCALLEVEGIRSVNLKGAAVSGEVTYETLTTDVENHEFAAFWYEKENRWVYADPCWSGAGDYRNGTYTDSITYDKYFDISGEAFAMNHRVDRAEERFYTKAFAAVEASEDTEILQTDEAANTAANDNDASKTNSENISSEEENNANSSVTESKSSSLFDNNSGKENHSPVPYIIIGAVGVAVLVLGIILAVSKHNKNKDNE